MAFRVSGLEYAQFAPLFELTDEQLAQRNILRRVADKRPGFPCRVSLQDAQPGESVLLLGFEHLSAASPYRSQHAIYVRRGAKQAQPAINEVPEVMRTRLISLRAFDSEGMMVEADVTPGLVVQTLIQAMLANPRSQFLHAHNAKQGCFAARIDRVD